MTDYVRIIVTGEENAPGAADACRDLVFAVNLRSKYLFVPQTVIAATASNLGSPSSRTSRASSDGGGNNSGQLTSSQQEPAPYSYECKAGVFHVQSLEAAEVVEHPSTFTISPPALFHEYVQDEAKLRSISTSGTTKTFCRREIGLLSRSFAIHKLLNSSNREQTQVRQCKGDFYNLAKVDTHVHLAAAMTAAHLLDFIKRKYLQAGDEVVLVDKKIEAKEGAGKGQVTLREVFARSGITSVEQMTVDSLDVQAEENLFDRFDHFNAKYNPFGNADLRTVFLKSSNLLQGRYFAELTREILDRDRGTSIFTEYRLSIYGTNKKEWTDLSSWVVDNGLFSDNNRWMIQCPRVFNVFKKLGFVNTFEELLNNVFEPLFEVTINPATNPKLALFLQHTSGFDSVDDESKFEIALESCAEPSLFGSNKSKEETTDADNPPYAYWCYYMSSNLYVLNKLREKLSLNTFKFRPHCGESGSPLHLNTAFLTADSVNHGIQLSNTPVMCYLYYLCQIGCAVSPLSNNALFVPYKQNPFNELFSIGLNVSLSTDDPMQFHKTEEPMLEEYQVAKQLYRYSIVDLCEIARNSCLQGGFSDQTKNRQLGTPFFHLYPLPKSNNPDVTNIPEIRTRYRYETYLDRVYAILRTLSLESGLSIPGMKHLKLTLGDAMAMHMDLDGGGNGSSRPIEQRFGSKMMKHVVRGVMGKIKISTSQGAAAAGSAATEHDEDQNEQSPASLPGKRSQALLNFDEMLQFSTTAANAEQLREIRLMRKRANEYKELAALTSDKGKQYSRIHLGAEHEGLYASLAEREERRVICRGLLLVLALRNKYVFKSQVYAKEGGEKQIKTLASGVTRSSSVLDGGFGRGDEPFAASRYATRSEDLSSIGQRSRLPPTSKCSFPKGVLTVSSTGGNKFLPTQTQSLKNLLKVPSLSEFLHDFKSCQQILSSDGVKSFCYQRLEVLERLFDLHFFLNHEREQKAAEETKQDFYSIGKVDTQVKLACSMTARELLEFTKRKWEESGSASDGKAAKSSNLRELFASAGITSEGDMTVDSLRVQADESLFQNFDLFQEKKNVYGSRKLREVFLKPNYGVVGSEAEGSSEDFFAEILRDVVLRRHERGKDVRKNTSNAAVHSTHEKTFSEFRLTISGKRKQEWTEVANWVLNNRLADRHRSISESESRKGSTPRTKFLIQIPRNYSVAGGTFATWVENLFQPLFDVTVNPESNPALDTFLQNFVGGFDLVGSEASADANASWGSFPHDPTKISAKTGSSRRGGPIPEPNFGYYLYFVYANLAILSRIRELHGKNPFSFRPHCGEAGDPAHLTMGFLLAHGISHGLKLKHSPSCSYLYYLAQVGISSSPLSNNALFQRLNTSPFYDYFKTGLNVSLATDMPLLFHTTDHPLLEEYTIAQQFWKMSLTDISEIAQNSVLQSGLDLKLKEELLGANCVYKSLRHGSKFWNHADKSNVPDIRVSYRKRCYDAEMDMLKWHGVGVEKEKQNQQTDLDVDPADPANFHKLSDAAANAAKEVLGSLGSGGTLGGGDFFSRSETDGGWGIVEKMVPGWLGETTRKSGSGMCAVM